MSEFDTPGMGGIFKVTYLGLLIQNILLPFAFNSDQDNLGESIISQIALTLDIICYFGLAILAVYTVSQVYEKRINWILIAVGSLLFVYFTLVWRVTLGVFPDQVNSSLSFFDAGVNSAGQGFDSINGIISSLIFSNFGLLLVTVGFYLEFPDIGFLRYIFVIYGIINLVLIFSIILVFLKIFTPIFAIPYFFKLVRYDEFSSPVFLD